MTAAQTIVARGADGLNAQEFTPSQYMASVQYLQKYDLPLTVQPEATPQPQETLVQSGSPGATDLGTVSEGPGQTSDASPVQNPVTPGSISPPPGQSPLYQPFNFNFPAGVGTGMALPDNRIPLRSPPSPRLPVSQGSWTNPEMPGNSGWMSTNETVNAITGGKPVQFKNGIPNFEPWSKGRFNFPNLTGINKIDFPLALQKIAQQQGLPSNNAATQWLKEQGLTLHHAQNGVSLDLIPSDLHNTKPGIPHAGGASILRNWDYSLGTPWQEFTANKIAIGGRYLGAVGMVYGAYTDGSSFYTQYKISQQTGNYSNTTNEAARIVGGWSGAWAVGAAGAEFGAGFGMAFGPVGGVVGGLVGGAIGGGLGYAGGSWGFSGLVKDVQQ